MVKVKLVENKVNRIVGRVMVVYVTIQNSIPGITRTKSSKPRPSKPIHEARKVPSGTVANADAWAMAALVLMFIVELEFPNGAASFLAMEASIV